MSDWFDLPTNPGTHSDAGPWEYTLADRETGDTVLNVRTVGDVGDGDTVRYFHTVEEADVYVAGESAAAAVDVSGVKAARATAQASINTREKAVTVERRAR